MLQSGAECYRVIESVAECYRVIQSITKTYIAHLLGPIFGLVLLRFIHFLQIYFRDEINSY